MTKARSNATAPAAKGELVIGTGTDASGILSVGSANQVLTVDSSTATGLKWATAGADANWTLVNSSALSGSATITISGISGANQLLVLVYGASSASANSFIRVRVNGDTAANYMGQGIAITAGSTYVASNFDVYNFDIGSPDTGFRLAIMSSNAGSDCWGYVLLNGCNTSGKKVATFAGNAKAQGGNGQTATVAGGFYDSSSTVSSISINSSTGNFDGGSIAIYKA